MSKRPTATGKVVRFDDDEIIVSKTDRSGRLTYANDVFVRVSGYTEAELIGNQHSIVRHPAMPRCIFKLLWDTVESGQEIFAYVLNLSKDGSEYWVFAHVTPSFDSRGALSGYHSNRRAPHDGALDKVRPLYAQLLGAERAQRDRAAGLAASTALLDKTLRSAGVTYGEFVFSLSPQTALGAKTA